MHATSRVWAPLGMNTPMRIEAGILDDGLGWTSATRKLNLIFFLKRTDLLYQVKHQSEADFLAKDEGCRRLVTANLHPDVFGCRPDGNSESILRILRWTVMLG